ncbi:NAD-dependent epimerase/dehydratase family protein [Rhodanobacter sp. DHG33]|uniref:NAD-dependent epimerase/dehydratase family protein n=1 Tax=Rhodanobacter sp. DHG33 TaxID=2775921 RepID=UPI00178767E8|nr:NAD-dependent epimerase/dehydratase family protein [Rhodanobacter sp. DHG33]MBD8899639.1 NAD-dependent epimerase/dehydratase family protein [Rhodanobacter sp. DHG33]
MTVLVFGGSSQIGRFLLPRLLEHGAMVTAVSRRARAPQPGLRWLQGSLPEALPRELPLPSAIVSFGPLLPFAEWLSRADFGSEPPRVIATSSMSVESKHDSGVPAERAIAQLLCDGEQALAAACARHGAPWTVLRPTLIYGAGLDRSLSPIARRAWRTRVFPLPAGRGLRQPVHADDIALAVLAALASPASAGRILPIGGGERLTAREMFTRVRRTLPHTNLPVPLPAWLLHAGQRFAPTKWRGPLARLDADLVADNDELERLLGVTPRAFQPTADMWFPVKG